MAVGVPGADPAPRPGRRAGPQRAAPRARCGAARCGRSTALVRRSSSPRRSPGSGRGCGPAGRRPGCGQPAPDGRRHAARCRDSPADIPLAHPTGNAAPRRGRSGRHPPAWPDDILVLRRRRLHRAHAPDVARHAACAHRHRVHGDHDRLDPRHVDAGAADRPLRPASIRGPRLRLPGDRRPADPARDRGRGAAGDHHPDLGDLQHRDGVHVLGGHARGPARGGGKRAGKRGVVAAAERHPGDDAGGRSRGRHHRGGDALGAAGPRSGARGGLRPSRSALRCWECSRRAGSEPSPPSKAGDRLR